MWSCMRSKANPRWLWHAIEHHSGTVLAYVLGRWQDTVFVQLKVLLEPCGIARFYTDGWGAYERHLNAEQHEGGKANTQKIESTHIYLDTRMKRLRWLPPRSLYHAAAYILGGFWGNGWDGSSLALPSR